MVLALAALELEWKDGGPRNEDGVNTAAEPRHVKLKIDDACKAPQFDPENTDLLLPGTPLLHVQRMRVGGGQRAEDVI